MFSVAWLLRPRFPCAPPLQLLGTATVPLRCTTHAAAPIPESECTPTVSGRRNRHLWTPDGDEKLVRLVREHGLKWTRISKEMGLGLGVMSYRRRWEVIHATNQGAWTLAEDRKLARSMETLAQRQPFGSYGWWVQIAKLMKTKRTPRDCYWRWNNTLQKTGSASSTPPRKNRIEARWLEDELRRFDYAILAITDTSDSAASVDRARKEEPWLVPDVEPGFTQPRGFWNFISEMVGTRTAQQCRSHLQLVGRQTKVASHPIKMMLSIAETKKLARIVEQHGKKWRFIQERYFPQVPQDYLATSYYQWAATADKYKVDLHAINPEEMLVGYVRGACTALRRTGANGLYDPNGTLRIVRVARNRSPLVPFRLALMPAVDGSQRIEGFSSGEYLSKSHSVISKTLAASYEVDMLCCGTDTLNRLIKSLAALGEDWIAIGKDMGMRASVCQRLYQDAVKIMPSIKAAARAGETRANSEE
ncbi:hypothetical protein GGI20_002798 [Coemansia sp. BCRC 34301]|nr:hypothetical protein GGI20_002798 [Coemansia sp. BCRC 34301]